MRNNDQSYQNLLFLFRNKIKPEFVWKKIAGWALFTYKCMQWRILGVHSVRLHPEGSKKGAKKEGRKRKKQGKGEKKGKKRGAKEGEKGRERKEKERGKKLKKIGYKKKNTRVATGEWQ